MGGDGEFTVEFAFGDTGVVEGEMGEGDAPAFVMEGGGEFAVADVAGAHEGVEDDDPGSAGFGRGQDAAAEDVVFWVAGGGWGGPRDKGRIFGWAGWVVGVVELLAGEWAAEVEVGGECGGGDCFVGRAVLDEIHDGAHGGVGGKGEGFF